jgi:hypothetical protein
VELNTCTPAEATLLLYGDPASIDTGAARLVDFVGAPCRQMRLDRSEGAGAFAALDLSKTCIVIGASSLGRMFRDEAIAGRVKDALIRAPFCIVYGITDGDRETEAVRAITDGLVSSVVRLDEAAHSYEVSSSDREFTREFTGLSFGPARKETDFGMVVRQPSKGFATFAAIGGLPFFGRLDRPGSKLFLISCSAVLDVQSLTDGSLFAADCFSSLIPLMMCLKHVFQDRAWQNPTRGAVFTIDDPLLQKSYGFLNYARIAEEMDKHNFNCTLAFIPWNYKRTDPSVAKLITDRSDRFSLCVHGCEHTKGEFATTSVSELSWRIHVATQQMNAHQRSTGVPYAAVMVFPQGKFSSVSLNVLKGHNYLAAVNSSAKPQDLKDAHGLTVGDLLMPAVTQFGSFPLFRRRYPNNVADFALDLFVGRPALLVEHHGYFRQGYEKIGSFARQVSALSPDLRWMGLGELLKKTYLARSTSHDRVECRIFGNRHTVNNPAAVSKQFTILKAEDGSIPIQKVTVDGTEHRYAIEGGSLRLDVRIPALKSVEIAVDYKRTPDYRSDEDRRRPLKHHLKVYMRRRLSEVRDNYLSKHERILALAYQIKDGRSLTDRSEKNGPEREG